MMDILNPTIIEVGNACYRRMDVPPNHREPDPKPEPPVEYTFACQDVRYADPASLPTTQQSRPTTSRRQTVSNLPVEELADDDEEYERDGSRYRLVVKAIPREFFNRILGKGGAMKREIATQTKTYIEVPHTGEPGFVKITGSTKKSIGQAKDRLMNIVDRARQSTEFTHFVSIPCNSETIKENFLKFKVDVLTNYSSCVGVKETLFQDPNKLHATITMLVLISEEDRTMAGEVLLKAYESIIREKICGKKATLKIEGVDYMGDDPTEIGVLYANIKPVDPQFDLQGIADQIQSNYNKAGLAIRLRDTRVKLHVTLMNTKFMERDPAPDRNNHSRPKQTYYKQKVFFDGSKIVKEFSKYNFGEINLSSFHLSIRHSYSADGYYKMATKIDLNQDDRSNVI